MPKLNFSNQKAKETVEVAPAPKVETPKVASAKKGEASKRQPSFVPSAELIAELTALSNEELVARALASGMDKKVLADTRTFSPSVGVLNGEPAVKNDIRGGVMQLVLARHRAGETPVPMPAIAAFMHLGVDKIYTGKFDVGYVSAARDNDGGRGMVARGFLTMGKPVEPTAGNPAPEAPKESEVPPASPQNEENGDAKDAPASE